MALPRCGNGSYCGMATIGQQFRRAREERGLCIEDVAFHTRIPAARLRDMEGDDLSRFANLTYARGFLKLYGEYLEMDLSDYLAQFRTEEFAHASGHEYVQTAQATQNLPAAVVVDHGQARRPGLYVLALVVLTAGAVVWWNNRDGAAESGTTAAQATPPPAPKPDENAAVMMPPAAPPPPVAVEVTAVFPRQEPEPAPDKTPPPKAKVVEEEPDEDR